MALLMTDQTTSIDKPLFIHDLGSASDFLQVTNFGARGVNVQLILHDLTKDGLYVFEDKEMRVAIDDLPALIAFLSAVHEAQQ